MNVPSGNIRRSELSYIDIVPVVEGVETRHTMIDPNTNIPSIGVKLFKKGLNEEKIKPLNTGRLDELFVEILDKYYELYKRDRDDVIPELTYDTKDDVRRLELSIAKANSIIAHKTRHGMGTVIVVPNEKIRKLITNFNGDVVINNTDSHKDKIFILRINSDSSSPGLTLFTDRDVTNKRFMKLTKILFKMKKIVSDISFDYCITEVGIGIGNYVQIIKITNN